MDFITDKSGRQLLRLQELLDVPDYVKSASVIQADVDPLREHQFADVGQRELPIDNPGHVYLSYAYAKMTKQADTHTLHRITTAADKFGIRADLDAIAAALEGMQKKASEQLFEGMRKKASEPLFAIRIDFGEADPESPIPQKKAGGFHGFYPINNEEQVRESGIKLANDRRSLPPDLFTAGARHIVKVASELQMSLRSLPSVITQYGIERLPDFEYVKLAAEKRVAVTKDESYLEIYKSAAENPENRSFDDYADLWRQTDELNGLAYSEHVPDPYFIFNTGINKAAHEAELEKWTLVHATPVPKATIAGLTEAAIQKFFPGEKVAAVTAIVKSASERLGSALTQEIEKLNRSTQAQLLKLALATK